MLELLLGGRYRSRDRLECPTPADMGPKPLLPLDGGR